MRVFTDIFASARASVLSVIGGRNIWGLADQLLISATNFVTMALVIKGLPDAAAFGKFSLVYSTLLFANIIQCSLVTQPHNVLGATREGEAYRRYTSATAMVQLILVGALALVSGMMAAGAALHGAAATGLLIALIPSIIAWQLQEFVRRVLYTEGRLGGAFVNDIISYGGQMIVIGVLDYLHILTGPLAMYALAVTSMAGVVVGIWQIRTSLSRHIDRAAIAENWHFGKWLAGSDILSWCSSMYLYMYLLAAIVGAQAAGILRAAQFLFGPARVFSFFLQTILPIRFARTLAREGGSSLHKQLIKGFGMVIVLLGPYCLILAAFPRPILMKVCKPEYAQYSEVLSLYAISAMLSYITMVITSALTAKRLTRDIFLGNVYGSIVAVALSWLFIQRLAVMGATLCMILTGIVVLAYYVYRYRQESAEPSSELTLKTPLKVGLPPVQPKEAEACAS
jgi:O-antigen/teichoic acid export membrane protein